MAGSGTAGDPYQVANYDDLKGVGTNTGAYTGWTMGVYYLQTAPIQCPTGVSQDNFPGIGTDTSRFTGHYDGQNYPIYDLYMNTTVSRTGLFASTDGCNVKNVRVVRGSVTSNQGRCGGMFGDLRGTVTNCHYDGSVTVSAASTTHGGFAGNIFDSTSSATNVSDCSSNVSMTTNSANGAAGFVGQIWRTTYAINIDRCFSLGSMTNNGTGVQYAGFVAYANGSFIRDCFTQMSITRSNTNTFGGFVGQNYNNATSFLRCYSASTLTGSGRRGFCGSGTNGGSGTSSNYFDSTLAGTSTTGFGTAYTTAQMKVQSNYSTYNFSAVWRLDSQIESGYPHLRWRHNPSAWFQLL